LIVLFLVIQAVTVRITYTDEAIINIDVNLLALTLYPSRKREGKKSKRKTGIRSKFIKAAAIKKGLEFLFSRSRVTVHEINIPERSIDPAKIAIRSQSISSLVLIFLTYLSLKSEALVSEDNSFVYLNNSDFKKAPLIDLTLVSTLYNTIIAFLIILFEIKKRKRKEVQRYVGNKNERYDQELS
jgi:hypothetical protein